MPGRKTSNYRVDVTVNGQSTPAWIVLPLRVTHAQFDLLHFTKKSAQQEAVRLAERANVPVRIGQLKDEYRSEIVCVK